MAIFRYLVRWERVASGSMSTPVLASFLVALLTLPFAFYHLLWRRRNREGEASLPPGPRGLPLLGYLPFLGSDLHSCFAELARIHGPVMRLHLGARLCIVLSSPAAVREAFKDHDAVFANHDVPNVALASPYANNIVWAPYGPLWRTLRKVSVRELLSPATIDALHALRRREVRRMVEEVRRRAGEPVNVRELASVAALNAMTMTMWGGTVAGEGEALEREFMHVIDAMVELMAVPNVSDFFPALAWLDLQGLARRMRRLWAWLDRFFDTIIDQRLRTMKRGGEGDGAAAANETRDFLQLMLEILEKGDPQAPLTMQHVKGLLLDMIAGGTDTTSTTIEWAMAELLSNPHKMTKAKEEITTVVGKDGIVEESHLPKLHYLNAVVKEVLRLHPVAPLLIPRCPSSTCTISGYKIPKGAKVIVNAWDIHRDPQFWEEASKFEPKRFLSVRDKSDYTGNSFHLISHLELEEEYVLVFL